MKKIIFVQPSTIFATLAKQTTENVVVLNVAFNADPSANDLSPEKQLAATAQGFIETLGKRLLGWIDRLDSLACSPLITPALVEQIDPRKTVETVIAPGNFDGVISVIKFLNRGIQPYPEADADTIAAASYVGSLSPQGKLYQSAIEANLEDDQVRQAIVALNTFQDDRSIQELKQAVHTVQAAAEKYAEIRHRQATEMRSMTEQLRRIFGREPVVNELAEALGLDPIVVIELQNLPEEYPIFTTVP